MVLNSRLRRNSKIKIKKKKLKFLRKKNQDFKRNWIVVETII